MIPGQMSLYGYWLDNFSYSAQMKREGYTNVYEAMPDEEGPVQVVDHAGNRYKMRAVMSFGSMAFSGNDRGYTEVVLIGEFLFLAFVLIIISDLL